MHGPGSSMYAASLTLQLQDKNHGKKLRTMGNCRWQGLPDVLRRRLATNKH